MLRFLFASVMCLLLSACASRYEWVKAGTPSAARAADIAGCGGKISHLTKDDPDAVPIVDRCMTERGYQKKKVE